MSRPRPVPSRGAQGFTLIELAVVITIMALSAAVVAPPLWRASGDRVWTAVEAVQGAYSAARDAAVARGGVGLVHVELSTGAFAAVVVTDDGRKADTLRSGTLEMDAVRLEGPQTAFAVARFDAFGRGRGDAVTVVGDGRRVTLRPQNWTEGSHVAAR